MGRAPKMKLCILLTLVATTCGFPTPAELKEKSPEKFTVKTETSKGPIELDVDRSWAPKGADRFYNLVKNGYYDNDRFFRVVQDFVVQFGINGSPEVQKTWDSAAANIQDDEVKQSNKAGTIVFATAGPNTRTTQVFINLVDNDNLDDMGFAPFGKVKKGMEVVQQLYNGYGESPDQGMLQSQGNGYLERSFPKLDYIKKASIN